MDAWYNEKRPNYLGSSFSEADVLITLDKYIASNTTNAETVNNFKMMLDKTLEAK